MPLIKLYRILALACAMVLLCACGVKPAAVPQSVEHSSSPLVFVGTYTSGPGDLKRKEGIFIYRLDSGTGGLSPLGQVSGIDNPSYLAIDPSGRYLLAVSESGGTVSSYAIDKAGALALINRQPVGGDSPCYVSIDPSGKWVLVANYMGGSVSVLPLGEDGHLGAATAVVQHSGAGPNRQRQEAPHVHSAILAPGSSLALVADLGIDKVMLYDLDTSNGTLAPHAVPALELKPGSGPRHMTFSPDGRALYVLSELLSTVTVYRYDSAARAFAELETQPLLPADFTGQNTSADIHTSPDGKYLYASNRGHNSITIFSIDPSTGRLALVGHKPTQGKTPRNFSIDPTGKWLLVANQDSNSIVTFQIDPQSGKLTPTGETTTVVQPVCVKFLEK